MYVESFFTIPNVTSLRIFQARFFVFSIVSDYHNHTKQRKFQIKLVLEFCLAFGYKVMFTFTQISSFHLVLISAASV